MIKESIINEIEEQIQLFGQTIEEIFQDSEWQPQDLGTCSLKNQQSEKEQHPVIPGLFIYRNYLSSELIAYILFHVYQNRWFTRKLNPPRNQHLVFKNLPLWLQPLIHVGNDILRDCGIINYDTQSEYMSKIEGNDITSTRNLSASESETVHWIDQLIANHYLPGEGLTPHVDLPHKFEDGILIVNVFGYTCFEFTPIQDPTNKLMLNQGHTHSNDPITIPMNTGDILCLTKNARWNWKHGIPIRLIDELDCINESEDGMCKLSNMKEFKKRTERVSITLRKLKPEAMMG